MDVMPMLGTLDNTELQVIMRSWQSVLELQGPPPFEPPMFSSFVYIKEHDTLSHISLRMIRCC